MFESQALMGVLKDQLSKQEVTSGQHAIAMCDLMFERAVFKILHNLDTQLTHHTDNQLNVPHLSSDAVM